MKSITKGYRYELAGFAEPTNAQTLQFIEKSGGGLINDGTTNEEVLEMLIDRITYLDNKLPSTYNKVVLSYLVRALDTLNRRTSDRIDRGVEGTDQL